MKREEYKRSIEEIRDPYSLWIRDREVKRSPEEFAAPEDYLVFRNDDGRIDEKAAEAFREYGAFINGYDFIYTDEDEEDGDFRHDPYFKPDYSPDTMDSFYYPGGFTVIKRELSDRVKEVSDRGPGSLEFLRECGKLSKKPLHIPEVLYHAFHHHAYEYEENPVEEKAGGTPEKIAVVILSKDHPELLSKCLQGLLGSAEAEGVIPECIVIDNGSNDVNTVEYRQLSEKYPFRYVREETEFVYSRLCNLGASMTSSGLILFLNDDIEIPEGTFIFGKMAREAVKEKTGAVGCRLLYPGETKIQHCGITLLKSGASHKLCGYEDDRDYYRGVNRRKINVFAVTGACLMVERRKFEETGGFDENLSVAYTDVDLCSALLLRGYYNVCLNDLSLIHHESLSRKSDDRDKERFERLIREREYYREKYRDLIAGGDPWYSRSLTETGLDYSVNVPSPDDSVPFYEKLPEVSFSENGEWITLSGPEGESRIKKCGNNGKVHFSIDVCEKRASDAMCHSDFTEISGWAFVHGAPGYKYDTFLLIADGKRYCKVSAGRIMRDDIPAVFPKERDICLSGFSVKISNSALTKDIDRDSVFLILEREDIFGRKRGYIAK